MRATIATAARRFIAIVGLALGLTVVASAAAEARMICFSSYNGKVIIDERTISHTSVTGVREECLRFLEEGLEKGYAFNPEEFVRAVADCGGACNAPSVTEVQAIAARYARGATPKAAPAPKASVPAKVAAPTAGAQCAPMVINGKRYIPEGCGR